MAKGPNPSCLSWAPERSVDCHPIQRSGELQVCGSACHARTCLRATCLPRACMPGYNKQTTPHLHAALGLSRSHFFGLGRECGGLINRADRFTVLITCPDKSRRLAGLPRAPLRWPSLSSATFPPVLLQLLSDHSDLLSNGKHLKGGSQNKTEDSQAQTERERESAILAPSPDLCPRSILQTGMGWRR